MKKKVLYGVTMAFLACASVGSLQSCKDDLSDLEHKVNYDQGQLSKRIDALAEAVSQCKQHCDQERAALEQRIQDKLNLKADAADLNDLKNNVIPGLRTDINTLNGLIAACVTADELDAKLDALKAELGGMNDQEIKDEIAQQIADQLAGVNATVAALETTVGSLVDQYTDLKGLYDNLSADVDALKQWKATFDGIDLSQIETNRLDIAEMKARLDVQDAAIDEINTTLRNFDGKLNILEAQVLGHTEEIEGLKVEIEDLRSEIQDLITEFEELGNKVDELSTKIEEITSQIDDLGAQIEEVWAANEQTLEYLTQTLNLIDYEIARLTGRIDNLITSLIAQGTDSPVFGNFSLPIGIQSNLLFNWYGYNDRPAFQFPNISTMHTYCDDPSALTQEDLDRLEPAYKDVAEGYLGDVNLGKLYLTINPAGHYFNPAGFSLETSAGNQFPAEMNPVKSDHEMYFGYTRGLVEGNGFYATDVIVKEKDIHKAKIEIEEGLKEAAKDALKDPSKRSAYNLLRAVYDQLNGKFPAYAARYNWTYEEKPYSVLSGYDIAATTAKPLSYSFLYGKGTSKRIPTIGHIDNILDNLFDKDKFKFELTTEFHISPFDVTFDELTFNFGTIEPDINMTEPITITVNIPSVKVYEEGYTPTGNEAVDNEHLIGVSQPTSTEAEITGNDLEPLVKAIKDGFAQAITDMEGKLNEQINQQIKDNLIQGIQDSVNDMLNDIQTQIDNMLSSLEGQINDQLGKIFDDLMGNIKDKVEPIFNKVNEAIDIYNKVAGKINDILADPNHYLQVAMFYKGNGTVGLLSNSKKSPTVFKNAGGNALSLYASSYSAEILAPAYLKYIAVSNVYNADGSVNTAEQANIASINEASRLNKVYPGVTKRVGVAADKLKKGLIYEIVYQGVDYSGRTSAQKFYIQVK